MFGDIYDRAGQYRTVNISKGGTGRDAHHFGDHNSRDMYLRQVHRLIGTTGWHDLGLDFGRVRADDWNAASAATFLHPHGLRLDSEPLAAIYRDITERY